MAQQLYTSDAAMLSANRTMAAAVRLIISDDCVFLFDLGTNQTATLISHQFGLIGFFIAKWYNDRKKKQTLATFEGKTAEEILSLSSKNLKLPYSQITKFKVNEAKVRNFGQRSIQLEVNTQKYVLSVPKQDFELVTTTLRQFLRAKEEK